MAQETPVEYAEPDMHHGKTQSRPVNVQAVEAAMAGGLSEVPVVKKVFCSNEGSVFHLTIVHDSSNNGEALERIAKCMVAIEDQLIRSGDAPDDLHIREMILDDSDDNSGGNWGEKTLFERQALGHVPRGAKRPQHESVGSACRT